MDRRVFHIRDKLSQSLGRSWSVDDMAAEVKMSAPHFQRLFKHQTGLTPMAYLGDLRLEKARELLADPNCFLLIKVKPEDALKANFGATPITVVVDQSGRIEKSWVGLWTTDRIQAINKYFNVNVNNF